MSESISIKKNAILNVIKTVVSLVFPVITFSYASRILGAESIGKVNYVNSILSYFILLATLGINNYGVREGARLRNDKEKLSKLVHELFIINFIFTIISYILLFICIQFVHSLAEYRVLIILGSIRIIFVSLGFDWLYSALEKYKYITIRAIIMQIIAIIMLFVFVRTKNDINKYLIVLMVSSVGSNIFNFINIRKYIITKRMSDYSFVKHIKPIAIMFIMSLSIGMYTNLDSTMLGFFCGDMAVGYYTAASKVIRIVVMLINAIGIVVMPRLSYYKELDDNQNLNNLIVSFGELVIGISLFCFVQLFSFADNIIYIFSGQDFMNSVNTSRILSIIILIIPISTLITSQIFIPLRKEKYMLICTTLSAVSNLFLNYILIPNYAEIGAAIATILAELVCLLVAVIISQKIINWRILIKGVWQYMVASLLIIIVNYIIIRLELGIWLESIMGFVFSGIGYLVVLLFFKNKYVLEGIKFLKVKFGRLRELN